MFGSAHAAPAAAAAPSNPDRQPDVESVTGPEKDQMAHEFDDGVIVGPLGTKANPVVVKTVFSERVVGCPGECKEGVPEGLRWWVMKVNSSYECPECGQWFKLIQDETKAHH
jgi:hypothetical protein